MMQGIEERDVSTGVHVFRVHFTADPKKRSEEWFNRAHMGFESDREWRREMEIDWTVSSGIGIFTDEFSRELHVSKQPLVPLANTPLILGFDFGLQPACAWGQLSSAGGFRGFRNDSTWDGRGEQKTQAIDTFADHIKLAKNRLYPELPIETIYVDPAGFQRAQTDAKTCVEVLQEKVPGVPIVPGPVGFEQRKKAIRYALKNISAGQPLLVLSTACNMLIEGFEGAYKYKQSGEGTNLQLHDMADKNAWSHIMDALSYIIGGLYLYQDSADEYDEDDYTGGSDDGSDMLRTSTFY